MLTALRLTMAFGLALLGLANDPAAAQQPEARLALVIGNAAYKTAPLRNPVNDARAMGAMLRALGFDVLLHEDTTQRLMRQAILQFGDKLRGGGVGLFYYAGHGLQVNGRNYMVPVDAVIRSDGEAEVESVDVASVLARMETAQNRLNVVILDACRDNPFSRSFRSLSRGLASIDAPSGTLIAYSTAPGRVAADGDGPNGLYTGELLKSMSTPCLNVEQMFKQARRAVQEATRGAQVPWESSSLVGEFSFARSVQEPDGSTMVLVPAGQFLMGTPEEEVTRLIAACVSLGDQEPQCRRWIAAEAGRRLVEQDSFWIDRYEVSNAQFGEFVRATAFVTTAERRGYGFVRGQGSKPGSVKVPGARWNLPKGPDRAAEAPYGVHDLAGNVWEWVDDWFSASDDRSGTPTRNPKGPHSGTRKIIRGGAWYNNWTAVRSARREPTKPDATSDVIGFRCARDLPGTANR